MYDKSFVKEILSQMLIAVDRVERRSSGILSAADFIDSEEGTDMLDAISMMIIAIGESCKNLDKVTDGKLLSQYPEIDWKGVKGMRDVISHHYFDINAEVVFHVCKTHIPNLKAIFLKMIKNIG